jgi:glycosyltransferase involved in cell wall biosynthesis
MLCHLDELPSAGFRVVELEHTGDPARVCNAGLEAASAPYAVCLDPDDLPSPEWLAACVATLEEQPRTGLAYTHFIRSEAGDCRRMELPGYSAGELARRNITAPAPLMRREVFEASDGYRANTAYYKWDFCIQAAVNDFGLYRVDATYYAHMIHGENLSLTAPANDGQAKANVVRNNPDFFPEKVADWARALLDGEPWADPFAAGTIPDGPAVEKMLKK